MSNVQPYLQHLVGTIGPRPASSDTERAAAEWIHGQFQSHGLASEIQDIETPRSRFVADGVLYLLTALSLVMVGLTNSAWLIWPAWAVLAFCGITTFLGTRGTYLLSVLMPKGPSQNVVARYASHGKTGERRRKVVVLAHYDTAVPTPLDAPATVTALELGNRIARYIAYAAPFVALIYVLPVGFFEPAHRWVWYGLLAVAVVPLLLALNSLAALALSRFSPGANTNGSGVAAMLAVLDDLAGEGKGSPVSGETSRIPRADAPFASLASFAGQTSAFADEPVAGGASARPSADLPNDFSWAPSLTGEGFGDADDLDLAPAVHAPHAATGAPTVSGADAGEDAWASFTKPSADSSRGGADGPAQRSGRGDTRSNLFATVEFAAIPESAQETVSFAAVSGTMSRVADEFAPEDVLGPDVIGVGTPAPMVQPMDFGDRKGRRSIFDFLRREQPAASGGRSKKKPLPAWAANEPSDLTPSEEWLGVTPGFDAESAGEEIGTWDNFAADDESGWKGGWAEGDLIEDAHYAEEEAARIRRRVAESATVSLDDKEVWFVATGSGAQGHAGMKALLAEYGADLRGASFINIDTVGEGQLYWLTQEGVHADVKVSARLASVVKRTTRDTGILAKPARLTGVSTEATLALRARAKAITLTRLVEGRRTVSAGTALDDLNTVDEALVAEVATFVAEVVRQS